MSAYDLLKTLTKIIYLKEIAFKKKVWKLQDVKNVALVLSVKELYQHLRDVPNVGQILQYTEHLLQRNALSDMCCY